MPLLMDEKGVFAVDIRLIRVAEAVGKWADYEGEYGLKVLYDQRGAAIQQRYPSQWENKTTEDTMEDSEFQLLIHSQFLGRIETSVLAEEPDEWVSPLLLHTNDKLTFS